LPCGLVAEHGDLELLGAAAGKDLLDRARAHAVADDEGVHAAGRGPVSR
jgi:hypothetical protein